MMQEAAKTELALAESIYALFVGAIVPGGGDSMTNSDDIVSAKSHKAPRLPAYADVNRTRQTEASILRFLQ